MTVTMPISIPSTPANSPVHQPAVPQHGDSPIAAAHFFAASANEPVSTRTDDNAHKSATVRVRKLWQPSIADLLVARGLPRPGSLTNRSEADEYDIRAAVACLDICRPDHEITANLPSNLTYIAGHDLLKVAVVCGDTHTFEAVCTLIKHRVISADRTDANGDTLLHSIARQGEMPPDAASLPAEASISLTDRVRTLLQLGADADMRNAQWAWPLTLAWQRESVEGEEVAKALLAAGVDPLKEDTLGFNQVHKACASGDVASVRGWINSGGDPDLRCKRRNETLIMLAACKNQSAVINLLVERGADVHAVDNLGLTALHQAVNTTSHQVVALLLTLGADPNGLPRDGSTPSQTTPLMLAARHAALTRDHRMLQTFMAHGGELDYRLSEATPSARELYDHHSGDTT